MNKPPSFLTTFPGIKPQGHRVGFAGIPQGSRIFTAVSQASGFIRGQDVTTPGEWINNSPYSDYGGLYIINHRIPSEGLYRFIVVDPQNRQFIVPMHGGWNMPNGETITVGLADPDLYYGTPESGANFRIFTP